MIEVSHGDVLRWVRQGEWERFRGRDIAILCDRLSAVVYRDIVDLGLARASVASAVWRDAEGREERAATGTGAAARLATQLAWHIPRAWVRERQRLRKIGRQRFAPRAVHDPERLLYLRTDHVFGMVAGGSATHISGVIEALRQTGMRVDVVSTDRLPQVSDDDRFHLLPPEYGSLRNARELAHLAYDRQLRRWLEPRRESLRPDVLYHRHSYATAVGAWLRADWGTPLVTEYNGSFVWMSRHWDKATVLFPGLLARAEHLALSRADLVVTVSSVLRDDAIARGAPPDRTIVEPNAVDAERYSPDADDGHIRERYGIPEDAVVVGFIGTFGPWHGATVLARAAARIVRGHQHDPARDVYFLLVGDGQEMPAVRGIIEDAGIQDRVRTPGLVPQAAGPPHLAACDILVTPQVPNPDGTPFFGSPTKLFEYMATGRAVVASDLGQLGEIVEHGRTGVLVPPGDEAALAGAVEALIRDPQRRAALGAAARRRILERHTWKRHVARILAALECADGSRPPGEVEA